MRYPALSSLFRLALAFTLVWHIVPSPSVSAADNTKKDKTSFSVDIPGYRSGTKHGTTTQYRKTPSIVRTQNWPFRWEPDSSKPITRVEIKLSEQRIYFMQDSVVVGEGPVSTGRPGFDTPAGNYKVLVKEKLHYSNLYGEFVDQNGRTVNASAEAGDPVPKGLTYRPSPMPYFLRISDSGMGMHEGWLPGYAASHGCIRLPRKLAPLIFPAIPVGCPVIIIPDENAPRKVADNK